MQTKDVEKQKAIAMRREGKTYSEILQVIHVAKSTLSIWLREVGIAKAQIQLFTEKKRLAGKRGGLARRTKRIELQNKIWTDADGEIKDITDRELFLIGIALYWAEGSKEKPWKADGYLDFNNMDPGMIKVFLAWLQRIAKIPQNMIAFDVYLHENHSARVPDVLEYWKKVTGINNDNRYKVYFKRIQSKNTNRKNVGPQTYFGLLRIRVRKSSTLVRKIAGWTRGIVRVLT